MGIHINRLSQNITYKSTEYNARRVPNREKKKKKNDLDKKDPQDMGIHTNKLAQNIIVQLKSTTRQKKRGMIEQNEQDNGNEDRMATDNDLKQK